jgi:hypothetical protein
MPAATRRSLFVTLFGVVGTLWFAIHAIEYVYARYDALNEAMPLVAPLGLGPLYDAMPQWAAIALTMTIWLGLLGAFLLLLGDRASVLVLSFTLLAAVVTLVWGALAFSQGLGALGGVDPLLFGAGQAAVALGVWLYARTAKRFAAI